MNMLKLNRHPYVFAESKRIPRPAPTAISSKMRKPPGQTIGRPGISFDPEAAHHLAALSHTLMHKECPISASLRELIAAYTSSLNQCEFCMKTHAAVASQLLGDEALVWSVIRDLDASNLNDKEKELLRFVRKVTLAPSYITATDTQQLNAAGWDDASIFYAISACALFTFYNRWISATGVNPVSDEAFKNLASRMAMVGYDR